MAAGFIVISLLGAAGTCLANDGVEGVDYAIWKPRPVVQPLDLETDPARLSSTSDRLDAAPHPEAPLDARQENGCPASSGLSPQRWICLSLPEARAVDIRLAVLEERLLASLARKPRRLGLSLACSTGAALTATGDFGFVPPSCGIFWGFSFRLGR